MFSYQFVTLIKEFMTVKMNDEVDFMKQHLQKLQQLKRKIKEHDEMIFDTIFNDILFNNIIHIY